MVKIARSEAPPDLPDNAFKVISVTLDARSTALISDDPLASLPPLRLTILSLTDCWVTDAGMSKITALPKLTSLRLDKTQVTDAGLTYLRELKSLGAIYLAGTRATDAVEA